MMNHQQRPPSGGGPDEVRQDDVRAFMPPIDTREIFRELIASELRNGRLTRERRRRIVRYAAQMGLSAVEAGRLIAACRAEALQSGDPTEKYHALRLVDPEPECIPVGLKLTLVVALAILVDLLVIRWLW